MPAMNLPKGSIISVSATHDVLNPGATVWNALSEHNRSNFNISIDRIGESTRTANGSLRKWFVADKRTFATSWENLPHSATFTVDGKWGGSEMEAFYNTNYGRFWLQVREPSGAVTVYPVVFKDFSKSVEKRGRYEFWNIDVTMEEV